MKVVIEVQTDSAAFEDYEAEMRYVLKDVPAMMANSQLGDSLVLHDSNGNKVGEARVEES